MLERVLTIRTFLLAVSSGYPAPPNGGNGGLSIRRRSIMLDVTQKELDWTRWNEDMWLVQGVKRHYDSGKAFPDQDVAMRFSFEAAPRGTEHWDWVSNPSSAAAPACRSRMAASRLTLLPRPSFGLKTGREAARTPRWKRVRAPESQVPRIDSEA